MLPADWNPTLFPNKEGKGWKGRRSWNLRICGEFSP